VDLSAFWSVSNNFYLQMLAAVPSRRRIELALGGDLENWYTLQPRSIFSSDHRSGAPDALTIRAFRNSKGCSLIADIMYPPRVVGVASSAFADQSCNQSAGTRGRAPARLSLWP